MTGSSLRTSLVRRLEAYSPSFALAARAQYELRVKEPEIRVLRDLVEPGMLCLDVGANTGVYSYWFAKVGGSVHAFEPHPGCAERLRQSLGPNAVVSEVALSNSSGHATLVVPSVAGVENTYRSSIVPLGNVGEAREVNVTTKRLDDFQLSKVGIVKIDVEGNELAVLEGASQTVSDSRPIVQVEAEERHRTDAVPSVCEWFAELGYEGWYSSKGNLVSMASFEAEMQAGEPATNSDYVNNFLFFPKESPWSLA